VSLLQVEVMRGEALVSALQALRRFFAWLFLGHICPQCRTNRTGHRAKTWWNVLYDEERLHVCNDCQRENNLAYYRKKDAREREARIEEMAEAIRRARCTGDPSK
jgi:hypothetical protein